MTQAAVTYDQVAIIATEFRTRNIEPSARKIRAELKARRAGTGQQVGSPETIQEHLAAWRISTQQKPATELDVPVQIPLTIAVEIKRLVDGAVAERMGPLRAQIEVLEDDLDLHTKRNRDLLCQCDDLQKQASAAMQEHAVMQGQVIEQGDMCRALAKDLSSERAQTSDLRLQLARAQVERELWQQRVEECAGRDAELTIERDHRVIAERRASALQVTLEGEQAARLSSEGRIRELQGALTELDKLGAKLAASSASNRDLRSHVDLLRVLLRSLSPLRGKVEDRA